jgi:hypothetical protein
MEQGCLAVLKILEKALMTTQHCRWRNIEYMHRLFKFLFVVVLTLFMAGGGFAANKKHLPAKVVTDTSKLQLKKFNEQAIEKFRTNKDFNYHGPGASYGMSLWERFWAWIWNTITSTLAHIPNGGSFLLYFFLTVAVGFLVYFILKSAGIDPIGIWQGNAKKIDLPYTESLENIHEINFDAEVEKAISQHNYRLAVRLLYLKCLKQLSDSNLIHWQIDKTNSAYLFELTEPTQKQTFGLLTTQFEYIWYGNFSIDQQAFGTIYSLFQDFKTKLP